MRVWRVHPPEQKLCPNGVLRWVLVWMSVCFLVFTVGPPSRSMVKKSASSQFSSCPPCDCFCSSAEYLLDPLGEFLFLVTVQCKKFGLEVKKKKQSLI